MENLATKATGDSLTAAEFNQIPDEIENAITSAGITLSGASLVQLAKAMANYGSSADVYTDSGVADAYVLSPLGSKQGITDYTQLPHVSFVVGNTNTGAATVNVNGLGVKNIVNSAGASLAAGDLQAGQSVKLQYDGTNFVLQLAEHIPAVKSLASSGYIKLAGGIIIQWGEFTGALVHGSLYSPVFPIAFPNSALQTVGYVTNTADTTTTATYCPLTAQSASGFTFQFGSLDGSTYNTTLRYFAIGF